MKWSHITDSLSVEFFNTITPNNNVLFDKFYCQLKHMFRLFIQSTNLFRKKLIY